MVNMNESAVKDLSDHDLLIRLDQKVDGLHDKVNVLTDDHEARIRSLEVKAWVWTGASGILASAVTYVLSHFSR